MIVMANSFIPDSTTKTRLIMEPNLASSFSSPSKTVSSTQVQVGLNYVQACRNGSQTESSLTLKLTSEDKNILWSLLEENELLEYLIHKLKQVSCISSDPMMAKR